MPYEGNTIITDYYYKNKIIDTYEPLSNESLKYSPKFVKKEDRDLL